MNTEEGCPLIKIQITVYLVLYEILHKSKEGCVLNTDDAEFIPVEKFSDRSRRNVNSQGGYYYNGYSPNNNNNQLSR